MFVSYYVYTNYFKEEPKPENKDENTEGVPNKINVQDDKMVSVVSRADFVDQYLGGTDKKTLKLLKKNLGKVLFVDEAYSLITGDRDMYGIEALTTLNLFMSQHPNEIIIIFAGYKDLIEEKIFTAQPGLKRRFMWNFSCEAYTPVELFEIFKLQAKNSGWKIEDNEKIFDFFKSNFSKFESFGGDTERVLFLSKLHQSKRLLKTMQGKNKILTLEDIKDGIARFSENQIPTTTPKPNPLNYENLSKFNSFFEKAAQ